LLGNLILVSASFDADAARVVWLKFLAALITAEATTTEQDARSKPVPSSEAPRPTVAELDAKLFKLDVSVEKWSGWSDRYAHLENNGQNFTTLVREVLVGSASKDWLSSAYWGYHSARLSFFISSAVAGLIAHDLTDKVSGTASSKSSSDSSSMLNRFAGAAPKELISRVSECIGTWQQDKKNIDEGHYKLPWDMVTLSNRQFNPLWALLKVAQFLPEAASTLQRRVNETPDKMWLQGPDIYPQYYTKGFHYQSDGWLSAKSAAVYEHSTETLFFGRQDAMQRTSLVPISQFIKEKGSDPSSLKLLEVAAGTGRFHTFIKDNWPEMNSICSDLSPFYLAKARENIQLWRQQATNNTAPFNTAFLQSSVEKLSVEDESVDIIVSVYLFHELPETIRVKAAKEFLRVLKPGGLMVINDSVQTGDRPEWDATIGNFSNFNEPYYRSFINNDLGSIFAEVGFTPETKWTCSASKVLSFRKP
jgi:ubiquinone/menaquinone biosynthesis C-methylase UbiE